MINYTYILLDIVHCLGHTWYRPKQRRAKWIPFRDQI
jgi:hypothetical protein